MNQEFRLRAEKLLNNEVISTIERHITDATFYPELVSLYKELASSGFSVSIERLKQGSLDAVSKALIEEVVLTTGANSSILGA